MTWRWRAGPRGTSQASSPLKRGDREVARVELAARAGLLHERRPSRRRSRTRRDKQFNRFPSAAIFIDFGSLCQKDQRGLANGGEAAAADAHEASRNGEEREAFGVALSPVDAHVTRTLPEGYAPDMRR